MVKLEFKRRNYDEMISIYKEMLTYIKSAVTRNYSEKVINKVLDLVSAPGGMEEGRQMELLHDFYETTLSALQEARNDRLWFKTNLKLGKLWFDREEYPRLLKILKEYAPRQREPPCPVTARAMPLSAQPPFAHVLCVTGCTSHARVPTARTIPKRARSSSRCTLLRSKCTRPQKTIRSSSRYTPRHYR